MKAFTASRIGPGWWLGELMLAALNRAYISMHGAWACVCSIVLMPPIFKLNILHLSI